MRVLFLNCKVLGGDNEIYKVDGGIFGYCRAREDQREKVNQADTSFVYSIKTNQELASRLKGHLMLVHGDMDNNVNPANSIRVADALIRANKRFEYVLLPGQRHGFGDMNEWFFWKMADWYSEWFLGGRKRAEVDIKELNND